MPLTQNSKFQHFKFLFQFYGIYPHNLKYHVYPHFLLFLILSVIYHLPGKEDEKLARLHPLSCSLTIFSQNAIHYSVWGPVSSPHSAVIED